ncbi:MAG: CDC48 family AAA ATPase [Nitrosopumilaceae archaeon]
MTDKMIIKAERKILTVAEANSKDVGRRIARIDPVVQELFGLTSGDAIEISSERKKANVLNWYGFPEDKGSGLIRIDGYIRNQLNVGINDRVEIKKIEVNDAQNITLRPTEPLRIIDASKYLSNLLEGFIVTKGDIIPLSIMGQRIDFVVWSTNPSGPVIVTKSTRIIVSEKIAKDFSGEGFPTVTYEDIGGLKEAVTKVREMIDLPLRHPELFKRMGVKAPRGVLLQGPPGTGKTLLAKAIANETSANFYSIGGPEIMSKYYGESEARLRGIFQEAEQNAPSIIFIDELDAIAPKRENVIGEVERRVVAQLLYLMDGLTSRGTVVVIAATNRVNDIDPALRRTGRFDREIEIGIPDRDGRKEILYIHTRGMPLTKNVNLDRIADISHGFVGSDLQALAKEAAMRALRRVLPQIDLSAESIPIEVLKKIQVNMDDFTNVLNEMEPSAMREVFVEIPNVHWKDIGGLRELKQELREAVEWPLKYRSVFAYANANPPKGIFLYGPPGTGKTLVAKAVANESESNFISIKGPELLSKWVGESEKGVREIFRKARQAAPCIVFFDEIDAIAPVRGSDSGDSKVTERMISQLLTELDGLEVLKDVVVIAASNRPDIVDPALLRSGRFDRHLYVPPPDRDSRIQIIKMHTKNIPMAEDVNIEHLADITENYTGADIASFISTAVMVAIRQHIFKYEDPVEAEKHVKELKVNMQQIEDAMKKTRPLSKQETEWYKRIEEKFGKPSLSEIGVSAIT